ncbi:MAG: hypothetical protein FWG56_02560 [Desulfovibrionaceae bacterium]|nr:hypothetical protein [Desulfovibrionaceae bacterium]
MSRETASIELLKPHRHGGRNYLPGQTITLFKHQADWLIAKKVAKAASAAAAPQAKAKE